MKNLLVIDDDSSFNLMLKTFLGRFYKVDSAMNGQTGMAKLKKNHYDLLLTDLRLPDHYGTDLLREVKQTQVDLPVILMTGYGDVKSAVEAMKSGAKDYISKPIDPEELLAVIKNTLEPRSSTSHEVKSDSFVKSHSAAAQEIEKYADLVAPTEMSVIITGESGTGKEYVSRLIHNKSHRKDQPFVAVDCGALPKDIAGSELFGHVKGAFTGAYADKTGCFEMANGGTLFLDEIGNLSYEIQVQLLRAIQERSIRKLGGTQNIEVDVRLIAATNDALKTSAENGRFREDLYHRLNEFAIEIPPLRERKEDIDAFAYHFLDMANKALNKNVKGFGPVALQHLRQHHWPGNLRELKNVIKRSVLFASGDLVALHDLPQELLEKSTKKDPTEAQAPSKNPFDLKDIAASKEKETILSALMETRYNKSKAAKILNIDRKTLYKKIRQFNIEL